MSESRKIIEIRDGVIANSSYAMGSPVNFSVEKGEQIAVVGDNAAGKTRFVGILTGQYRLKDSVVHYDFPSGGSPYVSDNVRYISFRDSYGAFDASYYMQQRWNQMDIDPETPTVGQILDRISSGCGPRLEKLMSIFHLEGMRDKYVISLSSGELRKFLLIKQLASLPEVLVMESPYIGLDIETRGQLNLLFESLIREAGLTLILVLSRMEEVPQFITHIVPVKGLEVGPKYPFSAAPDGRETDGRPSGTRDGDRVSAEVLRLNGVTIRYGDRTILKDLSWVVRRGEHWALTGANGSGKSTLLSLICADNPQAYACDIELFGRRRGTGESIWDIKKNIGYVSPEMHRSYYRSIPALDIVASGLFDTVGLYRRPSESQKESCLAWMERFGIASLAQRNFLSLSSGEQRMCLVARAFVKNPPLLILDEPMHGLDNASTAKVRSIIDGYCSDPEKTLIMVTHYTEELPACIDHRLQLRRL
ncbi:MAG: ATP-binding cassette domain-containing protein [Bacteroidales bacterium]|nr:ATP-binding cassette domain-containing protein [Bacteroidales bacterium]